MLSPVRNLIAFQNPGLPFELKADLQRENRGLQLIFELEDPEKRLNLPGAHIWQGDQVPREDGLWKETCFEMFLRPQGQKIYYEFNFSLLPAWNLYVFQDYREPQPPQRSEDFSLQSMNWNGNRLEISIQTPQALGGFEAGITAVLKEKKIPAHYYALVHLGPKADFHLAESFILKK